jgi:molybdopterin-guanine dinucleotide biosynthesis protein A
LKSDAVVLAGRENTGYLRECSKEPLEANIDIAGKTMVSYVLDSLSQCPEIGKVFLVGPRDGLSRYENDKVKLVEPGDNLLANVKIGMDAVTTDFCLVSTSDIPLVTPIIIRDFLKRCLDSGAEFCYPASSRESCEQVFPGVGRTYLTLREGTFTGGNLFFVNRDSVSKAWPWVDKMIEYRKNPLKMASVFGLGLVMKIVMKSASVAELEQKVKEILGINAKAILNVPPEIGVDVDKPSDLELCRRILAK